MSNVRHLLGSTLALVLLASCSPASTMCDDAGNTIGLPDAGVCRVITRCDDLPFCPSIVTNGTTTQNFLLTQIDIVRPSSLLATTAIGRLFNSNVAAGSVFWGLSIDRSAATITSGVLRVDGTGRPGNWVYDSIFHFYAGTATTGDAGLDPARWNPQSLSITDATTLTTSSVSLLTIPIATSPAAFTELPLRNLVFHDLRVGASGGCIGLAKPAFNSCVGGLWHTTDLASGGTAYATFEADIIADEARLVPVPALSSTLCNLTAGADCSMPSTSWRFPPDARINGSPTPNGWHLVATFAAIAIQIGP